MTTSPRSQIIAVSDIGWQEYQPGISFKILWQDTATKRRAQMTHFAPGAQLPLHRHVGDELIFVIEGAVSDESGMVTAGNVGYRPDGCVHTVTTKNGATVLAVLTGDIEPATATASAPPSQIFTLSELSWIEARPGVRQKNLGGQGHRAPRAAGALRAGGDAPAASARWRRADLPRRGRECGRIRCRGDRPDELPSQRLRPYRHDPERRDGARRRLGPHGARLRPQDRQSPRSGDAAVAPAAGGSRD